MKIFKKVTSVVMMLAFLLAFIRPINVEAAPAPTLTRVEIWDVKWEDSTGEVFIEVHYTWRPSTSKVTCNNYNCPEQTNLRYTLFGNNNIETGEVRFFKTPYTIDQIYGLHSLVIYAEAQTLRYPRTTYYDNVIIPIE